MAKKENVKSGETSHLTFPVVGIGASAGGLDALRTFLQALPAKTGMAFVFIQHLNPNHPSLLPEILERFSPLPVEQIVDQVKIEPDKLYVVPSDKAITTTDGILQLEPRPADFKKNDVIDRFFSSLGIVHQSYAVGIILSGALTDGTIGLQVIKSYGGLTFAQDGGTATFNSMPNSAVKAGVIDFVLPPEKIAQQLIEINKPFHYAADKDGVESGRTEEQIFKQILGILRTRRGVDFQNYRSSTLKRRVIRRMALSKVDNPADYLNKLKESTAEQDSLYNDMLISVTSFFRDNDQFNTVCHELVPQLIQQKIKLQEPLRVWVAGCATGEEAYSIAICMQEYLASKTLSLKVQIFATDVSEIAIGKARSGKYAHNEMAGLTPERIKQFFNKIDGSYQINKEIRDMCVFAHHNILKDPPFSKVDLLTCRNVLIYFEPVLQKKAINIFHYALRNQGYLWLGKSETIGRHTDLFAPFKASDKLYTRKGSAGRLIDVASFARENNFRELNNELRRAEDEKDIFKLAEEAMLAHLIPPCVLVNEKFDIIQFKGLTEPWLSLPTGKPSFNLLKMAKEGLSFELQTMLLQAKQSGETVHKYGLPYMHNDLQHFVNLQAFPLMSGSENFFLVVFHALSSTGIQPNMFELPRAEGDIAYDGPTLRIEQLERELIQTRANMRVITEEQEAAHEKLQSYNEELLSAGEEQQSLNEELETSKEELQSTNEEIIIVNKELVDRNEQLNSSRLYTEAIVDTIRDLLLVLDENLRVKRASRSFYNKLGLTEREVEGTLLYQIGRGEWNSKKLRTMLDSILPEKAIITDLKLSVDMPNVGKQSLLLNARQIKVTGNERLILLAIEVIPRS